MKTLDLDAYGVMELNEAEMNTADGGIFSWVGDFIRWTMEYDFGGPFDYGISFPAYC